MQPIAEALSGIAGTVLVALSDCEFIDSAVIATLLSKSVGLTREGPASTSSLGPNANMRRIVELIGLSRLFVMYQQLPVGPEVESPVERPLNSA